MPPKVQQLGKRHLTLLIHQLQEDGNNTLALQQIEELDEQEISGNRVQVALRGIAGTPRSRITKLPALCRLVQAGSKSSRPCGIVALKRSRCQYKFNENRLI